MIYLFTINNENILIRGDYYIYDDGSIICIDTIYHHQITLVYQNYTQLIMNTKNNILKYQMIYYATINK